MKKIDLVILKIYEFVKSEKFNVFFNKAKYIFFLVSKKIHIRMIMSLIAVYFVLKIIFGDFFSKHIYDESTSYRILDKLHSIIKSGKETTELATKLTKSLGIENLPPSEMISRKKSQKIKQIIVLKQNNVSLNVKNDKEVDFIPLCDSVINANIVAKTSDGNEFFSDNVDFKLGDFELPVGLERGMARVSSANRYDVVIPMEMMYFSSPPKSHNIAMLKSMKSSDFITYVVKLNKISKVANVGRFDPRVFYISRGQGAEVFCGDSVKVTLLTSRIDGSKIGESEYVFDIGNDELPYGLEHILLRLRMGDKVIVFMDKMWLKDEKNKPFKIKFPQKEDYLFLEISIQDVKQSVKSFEAMKIPIVEGK